MQNNDLISRSALLHEIEHHHPEYFDGQDIADWQMQCILQAPIIDAEPVRHGKNATYTHHSDMFVCSECGFSCEITELRYGDDGVGEPDAYEYDCKFCPNCGAKIDAEVKA